jgi:hypothetical protein
LNTLRQCTSFNVKEYADAHKKKWQITILNLLIHVISKHEDKNSGRNDSRHSLNLIWF